ncbi:MAG: tRNA (adenosine(37)-N6)-threonylcarbamoyltransferase complex dimerization subunit type 1 TsaB [Okeania sp. SIO2G4]|uniref:tRNA (adenosine(37)-N6)-threonylcarbamoyltransferase complex dimerization subunit type 1 TsaB n=1 Tax=unclassified Okeania TaxID=2634635 RepID=UPI0013BBFB4F|nr:MULTISPECIES: tRNA (adenosine(37)-N6)-threonylcarbamoyltransferase complex dimerization subunit type 1 TsaB [unclassified Okeania]NEP06688.1 tRNA (adenosine(37)-N6)-threonylcarbamoyltransferase complex dimerization subunit type 1 TsaB [Okeania sp. SIO4D6]NEP70366.1 tRNA (adenosine(37)-N6)-threonylcarbamoyltransferase complex dimerization subunit type 1 TsaB [Okeania sp. SIO2G5]NEP91599.1 tRNA (adenosine(37)-N6)-threonylcarbamoyltransferase complex dimerization subunit type 1 TsaB [Okeania sp.
MTNTEKKYGLGIHTSSPELGLAITDFAEDIRWQTWNLGRDLSTHLHQKLQEFLSPQTWQDLSFIAVAKGPGSFTGTRIGIVTARTLAQQLNIPLFAISTLAAVAWSYKNQDRDLSLQMPAQRNQLFTAIYQLEEMGMNSLLEETLMTPEVWEETLKNWQNSYELIKVENALGSSVLSLLELAHLEWQKGKRSHWSAALPFYGQHPVIERGSMAAVRDVTYNVLQRSKHQNN